MISIDDFYVNWKLIVERSVIAMISSSLDESKAYTDAAIVGMYSDRGLWDASTGVFPSTGGSGVAGAIMGGDVWTIQVPGVVGGYNLTVGDTIRAFIDTPAQTPANWIHIETGYGYMPFNQAGDVLTATDGTGRIGLPEQTATPATPSSGVSLFANSNGEFSLIDDTGNVTNIEETLNILKRNSQNFLTVDMEDGDRTLTEEQSQYEAYIIINGGDGSKTLTFFDGPNNPALITVFCYTDNNVNINMAGGNFIDTLEPNLPFQAIYGYKPANASVAGIINYVPYKPSDLMSPGWGVKVHFNKYGLIDDVSTITTADVDDSLNKRYVTEAQLAAIDDFIESNGDYVPTSRTINGHALTANVTVTKSDVLLGNVDNTSDINKPLSTAATTALNLKEDKVNKGLANGYVPLDSTTKIALTYLPESILGGLKFKGFWNAATNRIISSDPTINNQPIPPASTANEGWYFIVQTEGSSIIDGNMDWQQGDWIVSIGTSWEELDSTDAVWSVNGQEGIVTLQTGDIPDELNYRYVTDAEKTKLANTSGTNTGDQTLAGLGGVPTSRTVNGKALTTNINITPTDIGLGNVNNTYDADKPVSTLQQTAINARQLTSQKGLPGGYASLGVDGKVPTAQLPAFGGGGGTAGAVKYMGNWDADLNIINSTDVVYNGLPIPAADTLNEGHYFVVAYPGDTNIDGEDFWIEEDWIVSTGLNWIRVNNQSGVTSVNGRTGTNGVVVLVKADIGLGNVNNTTDMQKPVSTAQQNALDLKEDKDQKGIADGYAPLNSLNKVPAIHLPSILNDTLHQQYYTINATDITNKYITLEHEPVDPNKVDVVIYGGVHQKSNVDFLVTGDTLSWDSLALETLIELNQSLVITYSHATV